MDAVGVIRVLAGVLGNVFQRHKVHGDLFFTAADQGFGGDFGVVEIF